MTFSLGDRVLFDMCDVLGRYSDPLPARDPRLPHRSGYLKVWKKNPYLRRTERTLGVIVGARTLANGYASWPYSDEPIVFYPEHHFTAYLVAWDLHRRPVYLLPEDLTPEITEPEVPAP